MDFRGKVILAPMVRINTLPMRLLAHQYGADIVYTEELIDFKLVKCRRIENVPLGTVDFLDENHEVILRTCPEEKPRLVAQIGSADPDRCLAAAKILEHDVAAIDVNMGCPKSFSLKGGMGAALLSKPETIRAILTKLVQNLTVPVTCKIRVLSTIEDTVKLAQLIESTGVAAIAVHGRNIRERPQHKNRDAFIAAIAQAVSIPVIANGGSSTIRCYADIEAFRIRTGAASVMIARMAEHNCSIFDRTRGQDQLEDIDELCRKYIRLALRYDNNPRATKYALRNVLQCRIEEERYAPLNVATEHDEMCALWGMQTEYEAHLEAVKLRPKSSDHENAQLHDSDHGVKRKMATEDAENESVNESETPECLAEQRLAAEQVSTMSICFLRKMWFTNGSNSPKTLLHDWCLVQPDMGRFPDYETINIEKNFISICKLDPRRKYASVYMEKSKKYAEQASALVACIKLGLIDEDKVHPSMKHGVALQERTLKNAKLIKSQPPQTRTVS